MCSSCAAATPSTRRCLNLRWPAADRQHHTQHLCQFLDRARVAGVVPRPVRLFVGPAAGLRDRRSRRDQPQDGGQLHLPDDPGSGSGRISGGSAAELQRARPRRAPGLHRHDRGRRGRICPHEQCEHRRRISITDFGKRNVTLGIAPAAGVLLPATPVEMPVELVSHQVTARLNYRLARQGMTAVRPWPPPTRSHRP